VAASPLHHYTCKKMGVTATVLFGFIGLVLLMVVHESGHHGVARLFKLRVLRFSIGFGPSVYRHQPKGSDTVYQLALFPVLAYVQIAGMNPFEDSDPNDRSSYANASLTARIATVIAGPLANYFFASVLFFAAMLAGGKVELTTEVRPMPGGAAAAAGMQDGDSIVRIGSAPIVESGEARRIILASPNQALEIEVERQGERRVLNVTPRPEGENGGGLIGVSFQTRNVPVGVAEAARISVIRPAEVVYEFASGIVRLVTGREEVSLTGPIGIVSKIGAAAGHSFGRYLELLGTLSAYLGAFNLLPMPALDGGRLMFLAYEGIARRKPNARIEAHIHAIGLLMFLALIVVVSIFDIQRQ
jgi:regulator of sigma E protease